MKGTGIGEQVMREIVSLAQKHAIENTNQYIIGEHYWFTSYYGQSTTGNYRTYSTGSGMYYGKTYQKGKFIETHLLHN